MKHTIEIPINDSIIAVDPDEEAQSSLFVTSDTTVVELVVQVGDKAQFTVPMVQCIPKLRV